MYFCNNKNVYLFLMCFCAVPFISLAQTTNEQGCKSYRDSIPVVQLNMIPNSKAEVNESLNQTNEPESISYTDKLNKELAINEIPFRYIDHEYANGKFTTYPFHLVNEKLPMIKGLNPKYDKRYDKAFQLMISKLVNPIDLTKKEVYAIGSQQQGVYIRDTDTNKIYVFNKVCFDNKCALGQVFYILDPKSYDMTGILYNGCSFIKDNITGSDRRTKLLLQKYIDIQNPLDYSYAPNACKKRSTIARRK